MFPQAPCAGAVPQWHLPRPHAVFWGVGTEDLDPARGTDDGSGRSSERQQNRVTPRWAVLLLFCEHVICFGSYQM